MDQISSRVKPPNVGLSEVRINKQPMWLLILRYSKLRNQVIKIQGNYIDLMDRVPFCFPV